ncbi:choloylglycine hydrolase [Dermabacteraceae bacterium TAE3-ERU5]|nr:choloylglycine hydrolase [Dermabacteraceae bacterium TAE3-ERU5]
MCTALNLSLDGEVFFGRNLDLNCGFGEEVVVTPRNYPFTFSDGSHLASHHAMIGMATVVNDYPLYAEGSNEKGLSIAGLNFPGNAHYFPPKPGKTNVSPYELIPWLLGNFATLAEVRTALAELNLTDIAFSPQMPLAPLHWLVADGSGALVIESTADGLHWYENPFGVLTNNPPFPYHLENVKQYLHLSADWPENRIVPEVPLQPVGVGFGSVGLPGDTSPASRLVRAAFLRSATLNGRDVLPGGQPLSGGENLAAVGQFFRILANVAMVKGSTRNEQGENEYTVYSCCCDAGRGIYYYTTYENLSLTAVDMHKTDLASAVLARYPLARTQEVIRQN